MPTTASLSPSLARSPLRPANGPAPAAGPRLAAAGQARLAGVAAAGQARQPAAGEAQAPPSPRPVAPAPSPSALALALYAAMLTQTSQRDAVQVLVQQLAQRLPCESAWLALADGQQLRLVAASDGSDVALVGERQTQWLAACAEVFDQAESVSWPPCPGLRDQVPRIHRAMRRLAGGEHLAIGVPLVANGQRLGALCVRAAADPARSAEWPALLQHLAGLAGPLIALMGENEQPVRQRLLARLKGARADGEPALWQRPALWATAALVAILLWPMDLSVGGQARLEGAVQRSLAAPVEGYVQRVLARPGDRVRAGQVLLELADQDLQLDRERWLSQLARHQDALVAAQVHADRAQLVQAGSQAAEARAQLELIDGQLARSRLLAPFDGIVVQGDWSQRLGAPVGQGDELMLVASDHRLRAIVEIDERDVALIQAGQSGGLALSALPWQTLPLRVTRLSPVAQATDGRNVFEVEAELPDGLAGVRPGLSGSAQIVAGRAPLVWRWMRRVANGAGRLWWEWLG